VTQQVAPQPAQDGHHVEKIVKIGSREEIGACTVQECIERAGLDADEAGRLLDAVAAL